MKTNLHIGILWASWQAYWAWYYLSIKYLCGWLLLGDRLEWVNRNWEDVCVRRYGVDGGGKGRIILHPMKFFCVQICYSPWKEWTQREQSYTGGVKFHFKIKIKSQIKIKAQHFEPTILKPNFSKESRFKLFVSLFNFSVFKFSF